MLDLKKRKIANLKHYLAQIRTLRELGVLEGSLEKSLNGEIKKHGLFDSNYRMIELSKLWKKHGFDLEDNLIKELAILEREALELSLMISRALEVFQIKGRLPSVNALISELGIGEKNKSFKDELSCHLRRLVEAAVPRIAFNCPRGTEVRDKLVAHFSDPKFGRISKGQVEEIIRSLGFTVTKGELREFWLFVNQQERAPKVSTSFSMSAEEGEAIGQIANALNVSNSSAVSILIRGTLHLMASQNVNAVGFLEHSKKLSSTELVFISKFFSKVAI